MKTRAAVAFEAKKPLEIVDLATLGPVGRSAVAVRFLHLATVF